MTLNPSFASSLFSDYADATPWLGGSGAPSAVVTVDTFYFNTDNGDVYFSSVVDGVRSWQYQCNYFQSSQSRIVPIRFNASALADTATASWDIVTLEADEYITMVCTESIEQWVPNSGNSIVNLQLIDQANGYFLRQLSNAQVGIACKGINRVYPEQVVCGVQNIIHTQRVISLFMVCTTAFGFSQGESIIYLKIEKLSPTDTVTAPN